MNTNESKTTGVQKKNWRRRAIFISIVAHLIGAFILLFWYLPSQERTPPAPTTPGLSDPLAASVSKTPSPPKPNPAPEVPAAQIEASIDSQISQTQNLPDQRKLSELEKNLKRLDKVASPESIEEVSTKIASKLGLDSETYQPKEEVADGPFDPETAQIKDVIRVKTDDGKWTYESILIDAEGQTANVPMSTAEGQTTYETFQQMKKYPMAEGIYRSVVMPMLQKMIEAEEVASKAALKAERAANHPDPE